MDGTGRAEPFGAKRTLLFVRLLCALVQAVLLYWLSEAAPGTNPWLIKPMLAVSTVIPFLVIAGLGAMPWRMLAGWVSGATIVVAALAVHAATRLSPAETVALDAFEVWMPLASPVLGLLVAHALVAGMVREGRWAVSYPTLFDETTRFACQGALVVGFVVAFWLLLILGISLFGMLSVEWPRRVLGSPRFSIPATTLAVAVAMHVTSQQPALIQGVRALGLGLLGWLLPVLVVILGSFLASLPFLSLAALWATHAATTLLLAAAISVILLVNATYQDGAAERLGSWTARVAMTVAAVELVPAVGLAGWALALRVLQHGWTVGRIHAAAMVLVVGAIAAGYGSLALGGAGRFRRIETTNRLVAPLAWAMALALCSPLADPARLMVADQMERLRSGRVAADAFDYGALRLGGARWGTKALRELSQDTTLPDAETVRARAAHTLVEQERWKLRHMQVQRREATKPVVTVYPQGRQLPERFRETQFADVPVFCADPDRPCQARYLRPHPDGREVLLFIDGTTAIGFLFESDDKGGWTRTAQLTWPHRCPQLRRGFADGRIATLSTPWPGLTIGGVAVILTAPDDVCRPPSQP